MRQDELFGNLAVTYDNNRSFNIFKQIQELKILQLS